MQRDRDRCPPGRRRVLSPGALGAAGERGAELGAQGGRGRHHHPVAPAQRQVPRDELGEEHDHREPHRVAPRRRVEAGVGTKQREVRLQPFDRPARARVRTAIAQATALAGAHRQRSDRAELPGQRGEPARQREPRRVGRQRVLGGVRAQPLHVRRKLGGRVSVALDRPSGQVERRSRSARGRAPPRDPDRPPSVCRRLTSEWIALSWTRIRSPSLTRLRSVISAGSPNSVGDDSAA